MEAPQLSEQAKQLALNLLLLHHRAVHFDLSP